MQSNKKPWPLKSIHGIKSKVNTNPDYQRPAVWGRSQKQLLIDTILREYDVPKLYWKKTSSKPDKYDVIDGQQRLRTVWEFFEGGFKLPKDAEDIDGEKVAGLKYDELPDDLRILFDSYALDIVIIDDTDDDEVREMFLRLQNGTTLKAQEKRNAYPGKMRDFVRDLTEHDFFKSVAFKNSRYSHDHVAAQVTCLEIEGGPGNIKNADLNKMYSTYRDFNIKSVEARAVQKTLDNLRTVFPEKTPELERYNVISLYCLFSELQQNFVLSEVIEYLGQWFIEFEQFRSKEGEKPEEEADPEILSYKQKTSYSTDSADSIKYRVDYLMRNLLTQYPSLSRKDNQREFTNSQRIAIYRRDGGKCQIKKKCKGEKLVWENWHCDHVLPWSKGGKTTVENGQVSCSTCNTSKSNN